MAVKDLVRIPLDDYAHGVEIDLGTFAGDATELAFSLDRCTALAPNVWADPATYVEMEVLGSFDGGKTWRSGGGWGAFGGVHVRRDGTEATFSGTLPNELKPGGIYKAVIRCWQCPAVAGPEELAEIDARIATAQRGGITLTRADIGRVPTADEWAASSVRTAGNVRTFGE